MIRCFPDPRPDEILYSLWARFSYRVRYFSEKYILRELFGSDRIHPVIDLPCHIGLFTEKFPPDCKYTADYFIDQHTLFPLYSPFMSRERATALRELMIANESRGLPQGFYRRFGIANSLVPRMARLRYCPNCWQEDKANFGEAYWHRSHQVPGFEVCPLHGTFIENSSFRIRTNLSRKTLFSAECILPVASPRFADSSPLGKALRCIAEDIDYLLQHPGISLSPHLFHDQYRTLLTTRGFLRRRYSYVDLLNTFRDYYTSSLLRQFNCEMNNSYLPSSWLIRLVSAGNRYQHPLHHILAMHFLGATAKDFFSQNIKCPSPFGEGPWPCLNPACVHYHQRCINTYQLKEAQTKKNRPIGIFACICGFKYSREGPDNLPEDAFRKDSVLTYGAAWEAELKELWLDPTITRREIARFLGTSEGNVRNRAIELHLTNPRISPRNQKGTSPQLLHDIQWRRTQWLTLVESRPEKGRTSLQSEAPGLYKWLCMHDRDWLFAHCPPSKKPRKREGEKGC
jgi:Tn7-like transposition protein D/TniQ